MDHPSRQRTSTGPIYHGLVGGSREWPRAGAGRVVCGVCPVVHCRRRLAGLRDRAQGEFGHSLSAAHRHRTHLPWSSRWGPRVGVARRLWGGCAALCCVCKVGGAWRGCGTAHGASLDHPSRQRTATGPIYHGLVGGSRGWPRAGAGRGVCGVCPVVHCRRRLAGLRDRAQGEFGPSLSPGVTPQDPSTMA